MNFNSFAFVLLYLPIVCVGYFLINGRSYKAGKCFLAVTSTLFYIPAGTKCMFILFGSILINYLISHLIIVRSRNSWFATGVVVNVVLLVYCKYLNFFVESIDRCFSLDIPTRQILLPVGISFYTFSQIMFLAGSLRRDEEYAFLDYYIYILYFPKIIMGPLIEPHDFIMQINDRSKKKVDFDNMAVGIRFFMLGLFKKVIIADTFSSVVAWGINNLTNCTSVDLVIVIISYTMQIYFDFSGYSDMAVSVSMMLNIDLPVNFNSPYKAVSVRDFWKRWHISLTEFLTKYIYIPLGGSRKGKPRTYINTMAVFLVSGLWHGANWTFVLWGGVYGVLMCIERKCRNILDRIPKAIRWMVTFAVVNVLWILFWVDSIEQAEFVVSKLLHFGGFKISSELEKCFCLKEFYFISDIVGLQFITAHLWSWSMVLVMAGSMGICFLSKNMKEMRSKAKTTYLNLISTVILSIYCITSIGVRTVSYIYQGF